MTTKAKREHAIEILSQSLVTESGFPRGVMRLSFRSVADGLEDWALLWPPERGSHWCVNIHGHGSHGDQLYTRQDIRRDWLPRFRDRGLGILTPNLRDNGWMGPRAAADLHALLQVVRCEFGAEQFTFIGGSMGGSCNLTYAVLHPEDVAAVAAMCPVSDMASFHAWCEARTSPACPPGWAVLKEILEAIRAQYDGSPAERPEAYRRHSCQKNVTRLTMPVYVAHGDTDALVPVEQSRMLAALCRSPRFRYREIPGGDHEAPIAAAIMDEALGWILGAAGTEN